MEVFPLNRLPYSLKMGILAYSSTEELINLLQVNIQLRHYVLIHGPLPKLMERLQIWKPSQKTDQKSIQLYLTSAGHQDICLAVGEQRAILEKDGRLEVQILRKDLRTLLKSGSRCRKLHIDLDDEHVQEEIETLFDYLPRFSSLARLSVHACDFGMVPEILERLVTSMIDEISLVIGTEDELRHVSGIHQHILESLVECEKINRNKSHLGATVHDYTALQMTSIRRLQMTLGKPNFRELVETIFAKGLPSSNPDFHLLFCGRHGDTELLTDLNQDLPEWAEIVEDRELRRWFGEEMSVYATKCPSEVFIRRRITEKFEHLYLIFHEFGCLWFFGLSHPIS